MELGDAMTAIKSTLFGSIILLTACTPRPATMEVPSTYHNPAQAETSTIKANNSKVATDTTVSNAPLAPITTTGTKVTAAETTKIAATSSASAVTSWDLSGAMAARSKNKGWNASINWLQRGSSQYQIRLFGPLGSGTVMINKSGGLVTLRDGAKRASSASGEELLKQQTGVRLPVNNLYYWVRGLPAPGSVQSAQRDAGNRLVVLKQGGYVIEYGQYTNVGKAVLPTVIKLQGNGVFIKLVVKRWKI